MVARALLLLAAVCGAAFGVHRLTDHRACVRTAYEAYALGVPGAQGRDPGILSRELLDRCRGAEKLAQTSERFGQGGLDDASQRLARAAVQREPERWLAWLALAGALERGGDSSGGRRARARAHALNPQYRAPPRVAPPRVAAAPAP